jgi:hypothetical protein
MNTDWYLQTAIIPVGRVLEEIDFLWLSFEYPLSNPMERACWMLNHHNQVKLTARDGYYADMYRQGPAPR